MSTVSRRPPPRAKLPAPRCRSPFLSLAIGVGSNPAGVARRAGHFCMLGLFSFPAPVGVGSNDPHSVSSMWRADVPSSEHTPSSIKPQAGKSFEDSAKSVSAQIRGIFGEDIRRPNFANNSEHFEPQTRAISVQTGTSAGGRDVLAGETTADGVNDSAPGAAVKGADVIPDGELIKHSVSLALREHSLAVRFNLDSADSVPPEQVGAGKQSAAGPGK